MTKVRNELLDRLQTQQERDQFNYHPMATENMRNLAINVGIPLSVIAQAARQRKEKALRVRFRYKVPAEVLDEYDKWRAAYLLVKRVKQNG